MIRDGLSGRRRVLVKRPSTHESRPEQNPSVSADGSFEVVSLERETEAAVTVGLRGAVLASRALPGQFITVDVLIDGQRHRRSYSLTSLPDDATIRFTVKRVGGGTVSTFLTRSLRLGDRLTATGPHGSFVWSPNHAPRLLLIAGGSGITPLWTILRSALRASQAQVHLIYGNRRESDIIFRTALDGVARREPRLTIDHVLEEAPAGWTGGRGRLDATNLGERIRSGPIVDGADVFLCGPEPMRREARQMLERYPCRSVYEEVFARAKPPRRGPEQVTLRTPQGLQRWTVEGRDSILAAAVRNGIQMPFSCGMGGCGACRVRLVAGDVDMQEPNCLTPAERNAGFVLTCVGHPTSACELELLE